MNQLMDGLDLLELSKAPLEQWSYICIMCAMHFSVSLFHMYGLDHGVMHIGNTFVSFHGRDYKMN